METRTEFTNRMRQKYILFGIEPKAAMLLFHQHFGKLEDIQAVFSDEKGEEEVVLYGIDQKQLAKVSRQFRDRFRDFLLLEPDQELETAFFELLVHNKLKVSVAESVTGGMIASRILDQPGASAILDEAYVVYADAAKTKILDVPGQTLKEHGAVSENTAQAMAEGLKRISGADILIASTGIAGPTGGSEQKPVGLVYYGFGVKDSIFVVRKLFFGTRNQIRKQASAFALAYLIDYLKKRGYTG